MPKALKVMTYNLQQLPWAARAVLDASGRLGPDGDPKERARSVARAILELPAREQPDIVAFNEVFSETARQVLKNLLESLYPNIIEKLGFGLLDEDSGLMLFSKLPFLSDPAANGRNFYYWKFPMAAGDDTWAAKGIALVRVNGPYNGTTIAFTHLQASSDAANTEYSAVRAGQLRFIRERLMAVANGNARYENSVIIGDLNVNGDRHDTSGERDRVFSTSPDTFGADFDDGWRGNMHPPRDFTDYDPGYTHCDTHTFQLSRFDYQCTWRNANSDLGLIPHHMSVPVRLASGITDHWALQAHLHRIGPNCTPALAVELLAFDPINKAFPEQSSVWYREAYFQDEDMYHWVYISEPGTFSIFAAAAIEYHAFRRTDFTNHLVKADNLSTTELPPHVQIAIHERADRNSQSIVDKGSTFSWREPFFFRLRGVSTSFTGSAAYTIVRHRGESPATSILLEPHKIEDPRLPLGNKLNPEDECFFKAFRQDKFTGDAYEDRFIVKNEAQVTATVELRNEQNTTPALVTASGNLSELTVTRNAGRETILLVLRRSNVNDVSFSAIWASPLSYVRLDEATFRLHVDDETGTDWGSADTFDLDVDIDGYNVFAGSWDDADTGEDWPLLATTMSNTVRARQGQGNWAAFTDYILFGMLKTDGILAHGSAGGVIRALGRSDLVEEARAAAIVISDSFRNGHLTARASLSKFPPL